MSISKRFLFIGQDPLQKEEISLLCKKCKGDFLSFDTLFKACFLAEESSFIKASRFVEEYNKTYGRITCLVSPFQDELSEKLLNEAASYFPNMVCFPTDVLMREISFFDYSSYQLLRSYFVHVDPELLLTAGSYLRNGCNALLSAQELYIHRNTFNYRLDQFKRQSGLDIRDYHNALMLELYFQLSSSPR